NAAPELAPIADQTVDEGALLSFTASATDQDLPAQHLSFSLENALAGAAIDATTGGFSWTPTEAEGPADYDVTVKVTDDGTTGKDTNDATPEQSARRTVPSHVNEVNVAPVLAPIADQTVDEGAALSFTASATDADLPANTLSFALEGAPAGGAIDAHSGAFSW